MDRLRDISAAAKPVEIGGKMYWMLPLKVKHFGEAEEYMISRRPKPLAIVLPRLAELPEPLQRHLLDAAYRDETHGRWISKEEVLNWLTDNAEGKLFAFWCWIKQVQPEITLEDAEQLREELANSDGEPAPDLGLPQGNLQSQTQETAVANGAPSLGGASTGA